MVVEGIDRVVRATVGICCHAKRLEASESHGPSRHTARATSGRTYAALTIAELLTKAEHDAVHVRDLQATSAPDTTIMELAVADSRTIISADTDFGALLAHARATEPSVILVREMVELRPPDLVNVILANLEVLEQHLQTGAITAFTTAGIRVRALPLR
jgi:predicted nuclease of predicted toxin-antitoxin system